MRELKDSSVNYLGKIPFEWKVVPTKRLFRIESGATPATDKADNFDGDIKWVTPADYKTDDIYVCGGRRNLSELGLHSCSTALVPQGSIIFSKRAPIGAVAIASNPLCTNQGCLSCVAKDSVASKYYYYCMATLTDQYQLLGTGTTFKEISLTNFANFKLPLPSMDEQNRICFFLDRHCATIDSLIANQLQQIEKLKLYKQAVITEAVTRGLDPTIPMKDSCVEWIGKVPEQWKVAALKYFMDILPGYAFSSDDFSQEGIRLLRGINVAPNHIRWNDVVYWNHPITDSLKLYELEKDDIVVGLDRPWISDGTRIAFVTEEDLPALLLQRVCRIRTKKMDPRYLYHCIASKSFQESLETETTGVSVPHISTNQIENYLVAVPPLNEQRAICDYLDTMCSKIESLLLIKQKKVDKLAQYKKSLIYEVVTGKKEIP